MTIDRQTVPMNLSIALQKHGYPQFDSNFYWVIEKALGEDGSVPVPMIAYFEYVQKECDKYDVIAAAPTAPELAERVPYQYFVIRDLQGFLPWKKSPLENVGMAKLGDVIHSSSLTEAYARALLYAVMEDGYAMPEGREPDEKA